MASLMACWQMTNDGDAVRLSDPPCPLPRYGVDLLYIWMRGSTVSHFMYQDEEEFVDNEAEGDGEGEDGEDGSADSSEEEEGSEQNEYEADGFVVDEEEAEGEGGEESDKEVRKKRRKRRRDKQFALDEEDYMLLEDNQVTVSSSDDYTAVMTKQQQTTQQLSVVCHMQVCTVLISVPDCTSHMSQQWGTQAGMLGDVLLPALHLPRLEGP